MKNKDLYDELLDVLEYDPESGHITWSKTGKRAGWIANRGYRRIAYKGRRFYAHVIAFYYIHGYKPPHIDHINGDKDDNRLCNLRSATSKTNGYNAKLRIDNKSGVKGVSWHKGNKKWYSRLKINGKEITLGYFDNLELAELVIQEAREKFHGQFARHY